MNKLFDNGLWYIGYTSTELGDRDYDKAFCFIFRNPFDRSWKHWDEVKKRNKNKAEISE